MTTETMAMNIIDNGGERGVAAPAPLFASSWMALFWLLRKEIDSLREDAGNGAAPPGEAERERPRTN